MKSPLNIVVLATNRTLTLSLLRCLRPLAARVFVLADAPYPVVQRSRGCHAFALFNPAAMADGGPALATALNDFCTQHAIDLVIPSGIGAVLWIAKHRHAITACRVFPGMSLEMTQTLHNKWEFTQIAERASLPTPQSRLVTGPADVETLDLPFPVIAKPLELDAAQGVVRLDTRAELANHLEAEGRKPGGLPLLVQEFVPGPDLGLSILAENGIVRVHTIQRLDAKLKSLDFIEHAQISEIGRTLAAVTGLHGMANFDLRLDERDGTPRLFECNPRFYASVHAAMCCGVNFADYGIRMAFGEPLPPPTVCRGTFVPPERLISALLRGHLSTRHFSRATHNSLRMELTDPWATALRMIEKKNLDLACRLTPTPRAVCKMEAAARVTFVPSVP